MTTNQPNPHKKLPSAADQHKSAAAPKASAIPKLASVWGDILALYDAHKEVVRSGTQEAIDDSAKQILPEFQASDFLEMFNRMLERCGLSKKSISDDQAFSKMSRLALAEPLTVGDLWEAFPNVINSRFEEVFTEISKYSAARGELKKANTPELQNKANQLGATSLGIAQSQMFLFAEFAMVKVKLELDVMGNFRFYEWLRVGPRSIRELYEQLRLLKNGGKQQPGNKSK